MRGAIAEFRERERALARVKRTRGKAVTDNDPGRTFVRERTRKGQVPSEPKAGRLEGAVHPRLGRSAVGTALTTQAIATVARLRQCVRPKRQVCLGDHKLIDHVSVRAVIEIVNDL
jgi:hypothetical protein